jgi:hypothetical protein
MESEAGLAENRMAELLPIVRPNTGPTGIKYRDPIPSAARKIEPDRELKGDKILVSVGRV